ncbi:MAG: sensor histidine kinase N-terminal domain-containing protein [Pseudomonadales bacterium]|nr:sensor histidine kinase N-terminal domain-containing protein [Pseudomonadales bacterium]
MTHSDTLYGRLLRWLLGPLILVLLLGSALAYRFALHAGETLYDFSLLDDALDLARQVRAQQGNLALDLPPVAQQMLQSNDQEQVQYAAWDEQGHLFAGSAALIEPNIALLLDDQDHLFRDLTFDDETNRQILLRRQVAGSDFYIIVSATTHDRNRLTNNILASIVTPMLLLAITAIVVVLLGVNQGLTPVQNLRDKIAKRSSTDLRPVDASGAPAELIPIIHGINELLAKLSTTFASQRRFIADAAHQLRTPLASLSGQLEVALNDPRENIETLLRRLLATTQRTAHLSDQLLSLARLEHTEQIMRETVPIDLQQTVLDAAADFIARAERKAIELNFDLQPCTTAGSPLMLRELCANLLDNAVRYTPPGGKISVHLQKVQATGTAALLSVTDNGPGVPQNARDQLGIPFHRLPSDQPEGCGLGLAIVKEIARLHAAQLRFLSNPEGQGLRVEVAMGGHSPPVEGWPP